MRVFRIVVLTIAACSFVLNAAGSFAQTGNARRNRTDPTKALIPGVTITATNVDTNVTQTTLTNESGMRPLLPRPVLLAS